MSTWRLHDKLIALKSLFFFTVTGFTVDMENLFSEKEDINLERDKENYMRLI